MSTRNWEMGLTHAEFFRTLPAALGERLYRIDGASVSIDDQGHKVTIRLSPESVRRIALLQVPITRVEFIFDGHDPEQIEAFMNHFARYYQRGGG
jgi:hypothetical protein